MTVCHGFKSDEHCKQVGCNSENVLCWKIQLSYQKKNNSELRIISKKCSLLAAEKLSAEPSSTFCSSCGNVKTCLNIAKKSMLI